MKLEIINLSKTYPNGVQALKEINLTIHTGMFRFARSERCRKIDADANAGHVARS